MGEQLSLTQNNENEQPPTRYSTAFIEFLVGHPELEQTEDQAVEQLPFYKPVSIPYDSSNIRNVEMSLTQTYSTDIINGWENKKDDYEK